MSLEGFSNINGALFYDSSRFVGAADQGLGQGVNWQLPCSSSVLLWARNTPQVQLHLPLLAGGLARAEPPGPLRAGSG